MPGAPVGDLPRVQPETRQRGYRPAARQVRLRRHAMHFSGKFRQNLISFEHLLLLPVSQRACIMKLIKAVIYGFRNKLVLVPGKPLQPSLVFRDKRSSILRKP
jgi:hypothetical protein